MSSFSRVAAQRSASSRLERPTRENNVVRARLEPDGTMIEILSDGTTRPIPSRTDWSVVDATSEADMARHAKEDTDEAARDAAAWVRQVRRSVGLSQSEFSRWIGVPLARVRDWESSRQTPAGPERTLLRLIAYSPRGALEALSD